MPNLRNNIKVMIDQVIKRAKKWLVLINIGKPPTSQLAVKGKDLALHDTPEYAEWVKDTNARIAETNRRIRTTNGKLYFCEETKMWRNTLPKD